jgi:predicted transcriptional regulator
VPALDDTLAVARRSEKLPNGQLESLVMNALWDADDWLTPGDVARLIEHAHPVAYTTVMTILVRLWDKDMLERRQQGRAYSYHPVMTRDEWAAQRMHEFLDTAGDRTAALSHFVSSLNARQLGQLRRAVDEREQ